MVSVSSASTSTEGTNDGKKEGGTVLPLPMHFRGTAGVRGTGYRVKKLVLTSLGLSPMKLRYSYIPPQYAANRVLGYFFFSLCG